MFKLFRIDSQFYNQRRGTQINGPVIQFLSNIDVKIMEEPSGYSQENIKKIMAKYSVRIGKKSKRLFLLLAKASVIRLD